MKPEAELRRMLARWLSRSPAFGSVIIKLDKKWSLQPIDIEGKS